MSGFPILAFILLGIILFAFAGLAFLFFLLDHRAEYYSFDEDEIINAKDFECEWKRIGCSMDEHTSLRLVCSKGKDPVLYYKHCPHHGAKTVTHECEVAPGSADAAKEIYRRHCIPVLVYCEEKEDIPLEAPSVSVTYTAGEKSFSINSDLEFPEKDRNVINEVESFLRSLLPEDMKEHHSEPKEDNHGTV